MSVFTDLLDDVYTITKRPDLVAETKLAVRAATLKAHQLDYFYKDLAETGIQFPTSDYSQQLDYRELFPRWGAAKYLRKYDAVGMRAGAFFDLVTPELVLDSYGVTKQDVFYVAGSSLNILSSTSDQFFLIGFYQSPDITEQNFSSWVALDHPFAIVYEAAASLFKITGFDEQATMYKKFSDEQYREIQTSEVIAQGY